MLFPSILLLAGSASAFSNGMLLPSYLCGAGTPDYATGKVTSVDGYPKSLGAVLKLFKEQGADLTVAGFHNSKTIEPLTNLVSITLNGDPNIKTMTVGTTYQLTVSVNPDAAIQDNNVIGLLLYAMDQTGVKIGGFAPGPKTAAFPGCGVNNFNFPLGVVHTEPIEAPTHTGILFSPTKPTFGNNVTLTGLAITEGGFGFHMTTFTLA